VSSARAAALVLLLPLFLTPKHLRGQEAPSRTEADALEHFEKKIRPILHAQCLQCHGPEKQKAGLRVDSRRALLKGGDTGPAILPGNAEKSLLLKALRQGDPDLLMPPPKNGKKLPEPALRDFETWINAGAPFPAAGAAPPAKHWAFEPLTDPAVPGAGNPIDGFLVAKLGPGAKVAPPADRRTLIRRATYDLTGLPPSPEEVDAFVGDASPEAFSRLVERLLAAPAYGEKWGRRWLDVVRYADTAGENSDFPVVNAWRYRNYVIDAFNRDKPYDQFIREQIAGDLLAEGAAPERYAELITATGYLAIARRFGHDTDRDMHLTHEDVIDTLGKSILGLTLGCARCHNHKYDPVTARDYYALYGILASTRFPFPGCEAKQAPRDLVPLLPASELESKLKPWRDDMAKLDRQIKTLEGEIAAVRKGFANPPSTVALGSGELTPAGEQSFQTGRSDAPKSWVTVKAGEMLQFSLLPRSNHGADSTLLELAIAEQGGMGRTWNLTADLLPDFFEGGAGARHSDGHGNRDVWLLYDLVPGPTLFSTFTKDAEKTRGLQVWRGSAPLPRAFINVRDEAIQVATILLPARSFALHPGPGGGTAISWQSPIDGAVTVKGRVAKADPGGDGVAWKLDLRPGIGRALGEQAATLTAIATLHRQRDELSTRKPKSEVAYGVAEGKPADARLQNRGEPEQPGDPIPRRNLELFGGQPIADPGKSGRLDLARWLTDPQNPLPARVIVNRIWLGHFGRGLVATPSDFGTRGAAPTHPELLDHLATRFIAGGWSIKALHRWILESAAYQRASIVASPAPLATTGSQSERVRFDAPYAVFPRRRLDAEEIRDSLLAASQELDRSPGAGHPFPPEDQWKFTQHNPFKAVYESNRRSVYLMTQRIQRHPFLALFDGPDTNASTARRETSTVPTQALYFMNDPFFHVRAEALARRLLALPEGERIATAHQICFQRAPTDAERRNVRAFMDSYRAALSLPPDKAELASWSAFVRTLLGSNEFIYLD
jgi:hypothetical protein